MAKKNQAKKALISSLLALFICFTMLIGTTFAWFTDTAATGRNTIKSGNLDVVLEYKTDWDDAWVEVDENTKLFKEGALYEPGYTEVVFLRVSNAGSLALKYKLGVNVVKETTSTNVEGKEFKLSDYLQIGAYTQDEYSSGANYADILMPTMFDTREKALSSVTLTGFDKLDTLFSAAGEKVLLPGEDTAQVATLVLTMPKTVGNEANHKNDVDAPTIDLGITLQATQHTHEEDSFGPEYDENASLPNVKYYTHADVTLNADNAFVVPDEEIAQINLGSEEIAADYVEVHGEMTANNGTINAGSPSDYAVIAYGKATLNNVDIKSKGGGVAVANGAKVVFNSGSVHVDTDSTSGRYCFYIEGAGSELTINDGEFSWDKNDNQKRAYIYAGADTTVYVKGGTFGPASKRSGYTAGILGSGTVIITGGTFGFDPSNWVADGYEAVKNGSTWTVQAK